MSWEVVIGLEVHAQLRTASKIFSGASTRFGAAPNSQASAIDLGYPGVLPVLNAEAVRMAVAFGLAIDAEVAPRSIFARKNYFYPDLPKGYQISQYELPIVGRGHLSIASQDGSERSIGITRAHLEEDAGKSLHDNQYGSAIDLNRAGTPLLEIVTEPDLRSATQAVSCLRKIRAILQYLDICDGNMQEGSLRCDANVSVRPNGGTTLGTRTEIKNLNSFRFIEKAIDYEVQRQIDVLDQGGAVIQETRLYDSERNLTRSMRGKEEANDYRYFPDPDLLPVVIDQACIEAIRNNLPELPDQRRARLVNELGLSNYDAGVLTGSREIADFFETAAQGLAEPKLAANWVMVELMGALNRDNLEISNSPVTAVALNGLLQRIADDTISGKIAKQVFERMWAGEGDANTVIAAQGLQQITNSEEIAAVIDSVLRANPAQVEQYRSGKHQVLGFLVGQVMQRTQGRANPQRVNELLREKLG